MHWNYSLKYNESWKGVTKPIFYQIYLLQKKEASLYFSSYPTFYIVGNYVEKYLHFKNARRADTNYFGWISYFLQPKILTDSQIGRTTSKEWDNFWWNWLILASAVNCLWLAKIHEMTSKALFWQCQQIYNDLSHEQCS